MEPTDCMTGNRHTFYGHQETRRCSVDADIACHMHNANTVTLKCVLKIESTKMMINVMVE